MTSSGAIHALVLGRPGVYHYAAPGDYRPSTHYGFGTVVASLCERTSGVAYNEDTLRNLWPDDRICKFCAKRSRSMTALARALPGGERS